VAWEHKQARARRVRGGRREGEQRAGEHEEHGAGRNGV